MGGLENYHQLATTHCYHVVFHYFESSLHQVIWIRSEQRFRFKGQIKNVVNIRRTVDFVMLKTC